jgi:hypothetical protein
MRWFLGVTIPYSVDRKNLNFIKFVILKTEVCTLLVLISPLSVYIILYITLMYSVLYTVQWWKSNVLQIRGPYLPRWLINMQFDRKYEVSLYSYQRDLLHLVFVYHSKLYLSGNIFRYTGSTSVLPQEKARKEGCLKAYKLHGTWLPQNPWAVTFNTHRLFYCLLCYIFFIGDAGQALSIGQLFNSAS